MTFERLARFFSRLEATTKHLEMTAILAELFHEATPLEAKEIAYLSLGRLVPLYMPLEFQLAEKMMVRVLGRAFGEKEGVVYQRFGHLGDLGKVGEELRKKARGTREKAPAVNEVYQTLYRIANLSGKGSQGKKVGGMIELLQRLDSLSVRYAVRIPLGKLRLGFSDLTMLDALSWMEKGNKSLREKIEAGYRVAPDIGSIVEIFKKEGAAGIREIHLEPGRPLLLARCQRLESADEILKKVGLPAAVEPKLDGFRVQAHIVSRKGKKEILIFSRNLENVTAMYPDLVSGIKTQIQAREAVLDGEAIGVDPTTGKFLPFQETIQRKRKYDINEKREEIPLKLFFFDVLYLDGRDFLSEAFFKRRELLVQVLGRGEKVEVVSQAWVKSAVRLKEEFSWAIEQGLEGVVVKKREGIYEAGARGFSWVKLKRGFKGSRLTDTIDTVVLGYDFGQGRRTALGIGDFLVGVYNLKTDRFETVAKIGTGLSDEEWKRLKDKCDRLRVGGKPLRYEIGNGMVCDVWVNPALVVEVMADEITRSPVHTCGKQEMGAGLALRFPRLIGMKRDKNPEDSTSVAEMVAMYRRQEK